MIHILTPEVYNRIAAGEVVDRPYSVVKELIENAVDAGASEITIEIEQGGKKRIRVTDNGCGIEKSDLKNAFHPHATSKLENAKDLERIRTLGFRGEAVASIASVSRMEIVSRTKGGEAFSCACEGGVLGPVLPSGGAEGTCATVDDLFFNTPARLKFLKSDAQEEADVTAMTAKFLLLKPEIAFTYLVNGKTRYRSFGDGLESALSIVYGNSVLENCLQINAEKNGIRLFGFIGNQNFSKPNRSYQSLFVNGRYVVNQTVSSALSNCYASYLMKRQYPFYTLFLDLPPEVVDVNVHPNKSDVRFSDNQIIYKTVYSIVSAVLDGSSRALEYTVPREVRTETQEREEKPSMSYEEAKQTLRFSVPPIGENRPKFTREERVPLEVHSPSAPLPEEKEDFKGEEIFEENKRLLSRPEQEKIDPSELTFKGELFRTYLIYEKGDEAYLIDQHAAHERLLYDRLRARMEEGGLFSQPMLIPSVIACNAQEAAFLEKQLEILRGFGFEIEEFGERSFKVSAVPLDLVGMDVDSFFAEVLSSMETLRAIKLADILKDRLSTMACKAAVKGGEALTDGEARSLLAEMQGNMGIKCPHGRPACVRIRKSELEKLFKRIV